MTEKKDDSQPTNTPPALEPMADYHQMDNKPTHTTQTPSTGLRPVNRPIIPKNNNNSTPGSTTSA